MEEDLEPATLDGQFIEFAKFMEMDWDGKTISLYRSDYWFRQSKLLDDRQLTMTDTGITWFKFNKTNLSFEEWYGYLTELCIIKDMNQVEVESALTNCGVPGSALVIVPQYRDFFDTYKPRLKLIY